MADPVIRLYERNGAGLQEIQGLGWQLSDFSGVAPVVGDCIINSGVQSGRDRTDPIERTVYEVVARWLGENGGTQPGEVVIHLEVRERLGKADEQNVFD